MLKHCVWLVVAHCDTQPPSGGCVLKRPATVEYTIKPNPAAFGRLCVETKDGWEQRLYRFQPPSGGCVLKPDVPDGGGEPDWPAAFGRLCVETDDLRKNHLEGVPAAFGRLCVETSRMAKMTALFSQPPSGGCVLKPT